MDLSPNGLPLTENAPRPSRRTVCSLTRLLRPPHLSAVTTRPVRTDLWRGEERRWGGLSACRAAFTSSSKRRRQYGRSCPAPTSLEDRLPFLDRLVHRNLPYPHRLHRERVGGEHHEVRHLPNLDRPLSLLLEKLPCGVDRDSADGLAGRQSLLRSEL